MHVSIHAHPEACVRISAASGALHMLVTFLCVVLHFLSKKQVAENQGW